MAHALRLAEQGLYSTDPNPRVGCVIVRDGTVVGAGYHQRAGESHAEVYALRAAGERARGADVYVTLEPCNHHGRTPPCSAALIAAGVARVVIAAVDPHPKASGGIAVLRAAGIRVDSGVLAAQAEAQNPGFFSRWRRARPWVRSKLAMSLDGRTALASGASQWITGADARRDVQRWRARSSAILTGSGTVLTDNPRLTVRAEELGEPVTRQPMRVVIDGQARTPHDAAILNRDARTLIVTAGARSAWPADVEHLECAGANGHVDLVKLMQELARRDVNEVLVEAGARLNGALLEAGLIDECIIYIAPLLLGDSARGLFHLPQIATMQDKRALDIIDVRAVGRDWRLLARPK
ncbi:MAG: bifunctional diaminohydroxyphosphoribosylaminopyrimidine deaminase/5-amino-6-(5-phosphoribosylamino)uracil reductase RibD [Gammaproteobacteria bacterium]|nr:bifunctional diaminohydroxyphosphoribosylaminopyrimidine deaminase/5-amino-6-(5-phosphoribosylamino)uracil reductase RibD [Gammaproteobacteria bacterium]